MAASTPRTVPHPRPGSTSRRSMPAVTDSPTKRTRQLRRQSLMKALALVVNHSLFRAVIALLAIVIAAHFQPESALAAPLLMGVLTETAHTGGFMVSQAPGTISRDTVTVTVPANSTLQPG